MPENFKDFFQIAANQNNYNTRDVPSQIKLLSKIQLTTTYSLLNSIKNREASDWNQISKNLNNADKPQLIKMLREYIFNSYN